MRSKRLSIGLNAVLAIFTVTLLVTGTRATAQVLHSFNITGKDGNHPWGGLVLDAAGNLYGTALEGGTGVLTGACRQISPFSCGMVFELSPRAGGGWAERVLHNFHGTDGWEPSGNLIIDATGNLYGTTRRGGTGLCRTPGNNLIGCGTVFRLTPAAGGGWTETVLHSFSNDGVDGLNPYTGMVLDSVGNLYGTTYAGGAYGYGTVFELTPAAGGNWTETVLHSFNFKAADGANPYGSLIIDGLGNLYGTTYGGGAFDGGSAFELTPEAGGSWTETVLHNFVYNFTDGFSPTGALTFDAAGNLYGTTNAGGSHNVGTVFELTPAAGGNWSEAILYNFNDGAKDGAYPFGAMVWDTAGNLYGTTQYGGARNVSGMVFELTPQAGGGWAEKIVHAFGNGTDGANPLAGVIFDAAGNLYGTTLAGGTGPCTGAVSGCGTVFEIKP